LFTFWVQAKLDSVNLFNGVHFGRCATYISIYYMTSVSYQSSLSKKNPTKLYELYPDNSIKKKKQIYHNAYLLGEATVSKWI